MTHFQLQDLSIVSFREKRARRITFDPSTTLILGGNSTGKSSLLKAIYTTFGATPEIVHPRWRAAEPRSAVRFSVDDRNMTVARFSDKHFALFDESGTLHGSYSKITRELAPAMAEVLNVHLLLADRERNAVTPPPAFLFLPFYIDQDSSWSRRWSAFAQLDAVSEVEGRRHFLPRGHQVE